jgi:hypothetical protein
MSKIEEYLSVHQFVKLNDEHEFMCCTEIQEFCTKYKAFWVIDLISAYSKVKMFKVKSFFVGWHFHVEDKAGWLIADDCEDTPYLRRRLPYVNMENVNVSFLQRLDFIMISGKGE